MALSPLLQIRRMVVRRSSEDISYGYLAVLQVGFGLWIAYGLALGNRALFAPNAIAFIVGVAMILTTRHYRSRLDGPSNGEVETD